MRREGRGGRKREERKEGRKRVVPPRLKLVPPRFPWAGYGPDVGYGQMKMFGAFSKTLAVLNNNNKAYGDIKY
jgi:hypothetical protein